MATTGGAEKEAETTTGELDRTFLGEIKTDGVIAFGGIEDTFFYYPRAGFIADDSLDTKLPFNIDKEKMTKLERLHEFTVHFEPEGDAYQMRVFARVTEGKFDSH